MNDACNLARLWLWLQFLGVAPEFGGWAELVYYSTHGL